MPGRKLRSVAACIGALTVVAVQGDVAAWEGRGLSRPDGADAAEVAPGALFVVPDPDMLVVTDDEAVDEVGLNDDAEPHRLRDGVDDGQLIEGFGTGDGDVATVHISGALGIAPTRTTRGEDDGSIRTGTVVERRRGEFVTGHRGTIGDGPHGATSGDVDVYVIPDVAEGWEVTVEVRTEAGFDAEVGVYDLVTGELVAIGHDAADGDGAGATDADADGAARGPDEDLTVVTEATHDGDYAVVVAGCCGQPLTIADSSSGVGVASVGDYLLAIGVDPSAERAVDGVATEQDGSIESANAVERDAVVRWEGVLGDNPDAATVGDVDVFALGTVSEGTPIYVGTDTGASPSPIDTMVALYDGTGELVASDDDGVGIGTDSLVGVAAPHEGEYFAAVVACCELPDDPFDPTSAGPPGPPGAYTVELSVGWAPWYTSPSGMDSDMFLVDLRAGDVLAGGFSGGAGLVHVYPASGDGADLWSGSSTSTSYPAASPLRHVGDIGFDHVASVDGLHAVVVLDGTGDYEGELRVVRSPAEDAGTGPQIVFLDTDGADLDLSRIDPKLESPAGLGPLSASLSRWGLDAADEPAVVDAMVERVDAILARGLDDPALIELRWSDRDPDPWGEPNVSRVVIGASGAPTGPVTTGIAESVDPGNIDREETAVVLADLLSAPTGPRSINGIPLAPDASKAELVGAALGTLAVHEIGHLLGAWDTDAVEELLDSVMDGGGDLAGLIGTGEDGVRGTEDDRVPHLGLDVYASDGAYGVYGGMQEVQARVLAGLGGLAPGPVGPDGG